MKALPDLLAFLIVYYLIWLLRLPSRLVQLSSRASTIAGKVYPFSKIESN